MDNKKLYGNDGNVLITMPMPGEAISVKHYLYADDVDNNLYISFYNDNELIKTSKSSKVAYNDNGIGCIRIDNLVVPQSANSVRVYVWNGNLSPIALADKID